MRRNSSNPAALGIPPVNERTTLISTAEELSHATTRRRPHTNNAKKDWAESRRTTRLQQLDDELEHTAAVATNQSALWKDTLERLRQVAHTDLPNDEWLYRARRHHASKSSSSANNPNISRPF